MICTLTRPDGVIHTFPSKYALCEFLLAYIGPMKGWKIDMVVANHPIITL